MEIKDLQRSIYVSDTVAEYGRIILDLNQQITQAHQQLAEKDQQIEAMMQAQKEAQEKDARIAELQAENARLQKLVPYVAPDSFDAARGE